MNTREHEEGTPYMGKSSPEFMDYAARAMMSIKDIPGYVPPSRPGAQAKKSTKNHRYQIRMSEISQGMVCNYHIVSTWMQLG